MFAIGTLAEESIRPTIGVGIDLSPGTTYIIVDKLSGSGNSFEIAVE